MSCRRVSATAEAIYARVVENLAFFVLWFKHPIVRRHEITLENVGKRSASDISQGVALRDTLYGFYTNVRPYNKEVPCVKNITYFTS